MDSKFFCSFAFEDFKRLKQLLCCHSVLGISRIVHNIIADLEYSAWIIADRFLQKINVCEIIQIDDRP